MTTPEETEAILDALFAQGLSGKRIHGVGAGGSGLSATLWLAHERGAYVTACDIAETSMTRLLVRHGLPVARGHDTEHVAEADLVVLSPFLLHRNPNLPELVTARARGIPVVRWQALLGHLMQGSIGVSVAGVHGKGTTTALLGSVAIAGGLDPTVEVGATVVEWDLNARFGRGPLFINEADEWEYNFLHYHPRVAILTAVEYDHPEFFPSYEAIRDAFVSFLRGMDTATRSVAIPPPTLILNADSPGCQDVRHRLGGDWPVTVRTFGLTSHEAQVTAQEISPEGAGTFTLVMDSAPIGRVQLALPGTHNVYNALAAAAAADVLGVPRALLPQALAAFKGLRRRFEVIEDGGDVTYIDDYAHHPHAVTLTIETARRRFPGRRLIAVFQPTLYTRLQRFLKPFSEAFDRADVVVVVEIQPSREVDTGLIHGTALVDGVAKRSAFKDKPECVRYGGTYAETAELLQTLRQPGDVFVVMGSGPVNQVISYARTNQPG
jgi:UDP-N-acetylmuramate--alanine ligase